MQVPERLALIGGSILLASTLIFTLKSQASSIIPNVSHAISGVYDHIGDAQNGNDFGTNFQNASQKGHWGTSPWYVHDNNAYIGSGNPDGRLFDTLGSDTANNIKTINFTGDVTFPTDSYRLLDSLPAVSKINGNEHIDTSNVQIMEAMFENDDSLSSVDMSHMDTSKVNDMNAMIYPIWISQISLGSHTVLRSGVKMPDTNWKDNNNNIISTQQIMDGNTHPGTWTATWSK